MPEVTIHIGGRAFDVACQEGEQPFLESAARMLDGEAQVLIGQIGRMPELRMLLMAGLMLADKTAGLEDQVADLRAKLSAQEAQIADLKTRLAEAVTQDAPAAEVPAETLAALTELVERAEALSSGG